VEKALVALLLLRRLVLLEMMLLDVMGQLGEKEEVEGRMDGCQIEGTAALEDGEAVEETAAATKKMMQDCLLLVQLVALVRPEEKTEMFVSRGLRLTTEDFDLAHRPRLSTQTRHPWYWQEQKVVLKGPPMMTSECQEERPALLLLWLSWNSPSLK